MKGFLSVNVRYTQRMFLSLVSVGLLVTTSACSTGGSSTDGYANKAKYRPNGEKAITLSAGEAAIVNEVGSNKTHLPRFMTNDPYTALSPDEMIRLNKK